MTGDETGRLAAIAMASAISVLTGTPHFPVEGLYRAPHTGIVNYSMSYFFVNIYNSLKIGFLKLKIPSLAGRACVLKCFWYTLLPKPQPACLKSFDRNMIRLWHLGRPVVSALHAPKLPGIPLLGGDADAPEPVPDAAVGTAVPVGEDGSGRERGGRHQQTDDEKRPQGTLHFPAEGLNSTLGTMIIYQIIGICQYLFLPIFYKVF
jgi:hypothetical protein